MAEVKVVRDLEALSTHADAITLRANRNARDQYEYLNKILFSLCSAFRFSGKFYTERKILRKKMDDKPPSYEDAINHPTACGNMPTGEGVPFLAQPQSQNRSNDPVVQLGYTLQPEAPAYSAEPVHLVSPFWTPRRPLRSIIPVGPFVRSVRTSAEPSECKIRQFDA